MLSRRCFQWAFVPTLLVFFSLAATIQAAQEGSSRRQFLVGCAAGVLLGAWDIRGGGQGERVPWVQGIDRSTLGLEAVGRSLEAWAAARAGQQTADLGRLRWGFQQAVWEAVSEAVHQAPESASRLELELPVAFGPSEGVFAAFRLPLTIDIGPGVPGQGGRPVLALQVPLETLEVWVPAREPRT